VKNVLFRVDATPEIGAGHLIRCLALAQKLLKSGINPIFMTRTKKRFLLERIKQENIEICCVNKEINSIEDSILLNEIADRKNAYWVVLDGYSFLNQEYQEAVIKNGKKLLCIDDLAENHFVCDAVINQNIFAKKLKYSCESFTKLFLGTKYLLVEDEFRELINWERPISTKAKNILVTLGASSTYTTKVMLKICKAINLLKDSSLHVKVIQGFNFISPTELNILKAQNNSTIEFLPFQYDILNLMKWADIVITAAGSNLWKTILTYAPMMIFLVAENQRIIDDCLKEYNLALVMGWAENVSTNQISSDLQDLINSNVKRNELSSRCKTIVRKEFNIFDPKLIF